MVREFANIFPTNMFYLPPKREIYLSIYLETLTRNISTSSDVTRKDQGAHHKSYGPLQ